jgi:glutamyl-tRNA synthetase
MIAIFHIHDVNKAASALNPEKLLWLNQQHMVRTEPMKLRSPICAHSCVAWASTATTRRRSKE